MLKWAKFFAAKTDDELEQVAMSDPDLTEAKTALERLSADPAAKQLARERELAEWNYERTLRLTREEGREEGIRGTVIHLCQTFGIELDESRRAIVERSTPAELEKLLDAIALSRRWPDSLAG
jgi:hypothetical protein